MENQERPRLHEREPALVAGGAASALVSAFVAMLAAFGVVDVKQASAVEGFGLALVGFIIAGAPYIAARWTREKVMPVATVERAGLDVEQVKAAADPSDPTPKYTEGQ